MWAVCFQFNLLHCDDWENVYTLPYYHHQIGSMNPLFRVRSWKNGMHCMPLYILITGTWTIMKSPQCLLSLRPKITGPMARRLTSWMNKMRIGAYISIKMPIYIYIYVYHFPGGNQVRDGLILANLNNTLCLIIGLYPKNSLANWKLHKACQRCTQVTCPRRRSTVKYQNICRHSDDHAMFVCPMCGICSGQVHHMWLWWTRVKIDLD